ncbi:DUF4843 domain-containing protein [Sphingobacterium bovistauri]|uniref:DUF4843 domain-containing protein n=1 Tax=Sphingobacterium bovistauri TaxID=2781959 RepID=A0ABS7ZCS5_9SPHI|nr:DUF4843 domain-containing protein [Sphingobacterium bovistauri]MCA5006744.1 DUF4843 domain-containing protein [Sphingobacterium bovistauri]
MKETTSFICLIALLIFGCSQNADILDYNRESSYVYFAYPNPDTRAVQKYTDSIFYSFALDEAIGINEKTLKIPIAITGQSSAHDRKYTIQISDKSDFDSNLVTISEPIIQKGLFVDTLYINIKRGQELSSKKMNIILDIADNENFKIGNAFNKTLKIAFSDILIQPSWWNTWSTYFGDYQKEKYQKWIELYPLGADPSPEYFNNIPGPYYYWNRMPSFVSTGIFTITIMYIEKLKKYFDENVVYPNGDTTQPRILLP